MTRFATEPYKKPKPGNLQDLFRHLTNYSVNKRNEHYQQPQSASRTDFGHKRSVSSVFAALAAEGCNIASLQKEIDRLIVLTIICGQPYISHNYKTGIKTDDGKSRCFEIIGFDILIDKDMKPWLLEVNHAPSLLCESPFDKELKDGVISGAMKIMDIDPYFRKKIMAMEHADTLSRINGGASTRRAKIFDPNRESEIARTTQWRQLYPVLEDPEQQRTYDEVLMIGSTLAPTGSYDTAASQRRREAIQAVLLEKREEELCEKPKRVIKIPKQASAPLANVRVPRAQLLLRQAKMERLKIDARREEASKAKRESEVGRTGERTVTIRDGGSAKGGHCVTQHMVLDVGNSKSNG
jgi:tubulin polyglutamylase TTLL6/13